MLEIVHDLAPGADLYFATAFGGHGFIRREHRGAVRGRSRRHRRRRLLFPGSALPGRHHLAGSQRGGGRRLLLLLGRGKRRQQERRHCGRLGRRFRRREPAGPQRRPRRDSSRLRKRRDPEPHHRGHRRGLRPLVGRSAGGFGQRLRPVSGRRERRCSEEFDPHPGRHPGPVRVHQLHEEDHTGARLVIVKTSGAADRYLRLDTLEGQLAVSTAGVLFGHSAAENAISIAAVAVQSAGGAGGVFDGTESVRTSSSDGPRRIFFEPDGTPITPEISPPPAESCCRNRIWLPPPAYGPRRRGFRSSAASLQRLPTRLPSGPWCWKGPKDPTI